jgi:hypothetical protein
MGFWNSIFGKKKKEMIMDDFFGELSIVDNFCETNQHFTPINKSVELLLSFENGKSNNEQIAFYKLIEQNYAALIPKFITAIEHQFSQWRDDVKVVNFENEFTLMCLNLPICKAKPISWDISFDTIHDLNHTITISMKDFDIENIMIDG